MSELAYIGLGANLGDTRLALEQALAALAALPDTRLLAVSGAYRSAPVDAGGPDFLNAVALLETRLTPETLLDALLAIELEQGRERPYRHAPRTLDLDLLLQGQARVETARLSLPHPRLHLRAFVLQPLLELSPDLQIPELGNLRSHLAATDGQAIERLPITLSPVPRMTR
ncbi:2-amino-4-hydroxy-6-hydroxymethyldihydropteridine diphosphokinase [Pelomonas sp. SE-A7]|uniref:2-amino-4-hydroxy-6- hydroxymethyldihydropteridine diphosphokinase n=1 Tax=Pelomonas sp. SE-A7 TaxID=3054953 RepID=UPI00259CF8EF|nr:2-amino-4-hydroxy-6-hydroxymethyldihydropteridine diphosphokinase [Pelomonas sp. SE-A7]MDM4764688.1 2-amino-4-hydroxy-6-hydroxymethyldihydropteridine diphosphokinase [Pelomonas sp. SE-A7]